MNKLTAVAAVLAFAGAASGQVQFSLTAGGSGDFDGSGNQAGSLTASSSFYQDGFGGDFAPASNFIGLVPTLEFDTYVHIGDGAQNGTSMFAANSSFDGIEPDFSSNGLTGFWTAGGNGVASGDDNAIFLGRFTTLGAGSSVSGSLALFNLIEAGASSIGNEFYNVEIGGDFAALTGAQVEAPFASVTTSNLYRIENRQSAVQITGVDYVVNDLFLVADIPTPGATGLLAVAGLAAARRRRA